MDGDEMVPQRREETNMEAERDEILESADGDMHAFLSAMESTRGIAESDYTQKLQALADKNNTMHKQAGSLEDSQRQQH